VQQLRDGADFANVAMDFSEDPNTSVNGGDLGFLPESQFPDPNMRKMLAALTPGQTTGVLALPNGYTILKLVTKETPGQRQLTDPQVQQAIRDTLRGRKEQLMRAAYLVSARDQSRIANFLARQVMESEGKLPVIKIQPPAAAVPGAIAPTPAPTSAPAPPAQPAPATKQ
jgi:peptidyl-prolyl cis-trans isomerase SurA